jgi:hypothetical protein
MFWQERFVKNNDAKQDRADRNEECHEQDVRRACGRENAEIQNESERRGQGRDAENRTNHRRAWHRQCPRVIDKQRDRQNHNA